MYKQRIHEHVNINIFTYHCKICQKNNINNNNQDKDGKLLSQITGKKESTKTTFHKIIELCSGPYHITRVI